MCLGAQWCPTLWNLMDCSRLGSSVHRDPPGKNTGVGCHALLQGIFPTQGLNPGLPHCGWILYRLSHQGRPGGGFLLPSVLFSSVAQSCLTFCDLMERISLLLIFTLKSLLHITARLIPILSACPYPTLVLFTSRIKFFPFCSNSVLPAPILSHTLSTFAHYFLDTKAKIQQ